MSDEKEYTVIVSTTGDANSDPGYIGNGKTKLTMKESELNDKHHAIFLGELVKQYNDSPTRTKNLFKKWVETQ